MCNNIVIVGRIGQDIKTFDKGCRFSVAVNRYRKEDGPDWFNVTAFGKTADFVVKYLGKGSLVSVVGRMESSKKDDKTYWGIVASDVQSLGSKEKEESDDPFED